MPNPSAFIEFHADSNRDEGVNGSTLDLDVPGFKAHAEEIALRVADVDIAQIQETFVFVRGGKILSEVFKSVADLADVEIAATVK